MALLFLGFGYVLDIKEERRKSKINVNRECVGAKTAVVLTYIYIEPKSSFN